MTRPPQPPARNWSTGARAPAATARVAACAALLAAAQPIAAASLPDSAPVDDYPRRRAGLWEVDTVGAQAAGLPAARYCVDESTDRPAQHLDRTFGAKGACRFGAFRRAGNAWVSETVCREPRAVVTTRSVATGDFASSYRIDTLITYEPPLAGIRREERTATVARWVGPCQSGQQAGDLALPGMGSLNMKDGSVSAEPEAPRPAPRRRSSKHTEG